MKKIIVVLSLVVLAIGGGLFWYFSMSTHARVMRHIQNVENTWLKNDILISGIMESNQRSASLSEGDIIKLDRQWQAEQLSGKFDLVNQVVENNVSNYVLDLVNKSNGLYTEIIVMNNKGLTVGASYETSDYWQGDEAKWQKTYAKGAGAVFIDKVQYDESSISYGTQVSFTVTNPRTNDAIGAITIGLDMTKLK